MAANCHRRMRDIVDGSSNTLLIGERAHGNPGDRIAGIWSGMHGCTATGCWNADSVLGVEGRINPPTRFGFSSRHPGGAHFLLADGSVRFLNENIELVTLMRLGQRADRQVVGEF